MCDMEAVNGSYDRESEVRDELAYVRPMMSSQNGEINGETTTENFKVFNVPNDRIKRKAKRPSQFLNNSSDTNFINVNLQQSNGTGNKCVAVKNSRKSRNGMRFGRGLPKKGQ